MVQLWLFILLARTLFENFIVLECLYGSFIDGFSSQDTRSSTLSFSLDNQVSHLHLVARKNPPELLL